MKSLHTDSQWLEIFNTGKKSNQITKDIGCTKDTVGRARARVIDQIEIPYIDKNPGTHGKSKLSCFHEDFRNMLSWGWNSVSMFKFINVVRGVEVSIACVKKYCASRFEIGETSASVIMAAARARTAYLIPSLTKGLS